MRNLTNASRTRLKLATLVLVFLAGITIFAMLQEMEGVASTAIAGILTVSTMYIGGDSYRKSDKKQ